MAALSWPPPHRARVNLFLPKSISNFFYTSSSSSAAASFLFQRELLDLTPAWILSSFRLEKTISLFISGQRPINQFFSSRLSKQKKSRKKYTRRKYQMFHSSLASLAWLSSRFWLHNVRSSRSKNDTKYFLSSTTATTDDLNFCGVCSQQQQLMSESAAWLHLTNTHPAAHTHTHRHKQTATHTLSAAPTAAARCKQLNYKAAAQAVASNLLNIGKAHTHTHIQGVQGHTRAVCLLL